MRLPAPIRLPATPGLAGDAGRRARLGRWLVLTHGATLLATGAWPLLDLRSFELVTGPKREDWLVRAVGGLAIAFGAGSLWRADEPRAVRPFGLAAALTFATADVIGVASGRLRRVYLLDALVEGLFAAGWVLSALPGRRPPRPRPAIVPVQADRDRPPQDLTSIRREVEGRHRDAARAASLAWPSGGTPDAVTEALHRLDETRENLAFAVEGVDAEGVLGLAAAAAEDAAAVHEAADLISS